MRHPVLTCLITLLLALGGCATLGSSSPAEQRAALRGKTVVITGASSGFGRGLALAFAERGANVVIAARRTALLEEVAEQARTAGGQALVVTADVGVEDDVRRLHETALVRFGAVDVWINNAGVGALGRFDETPVEDHERIVRTNLMGVIYGSHHALGHFRQQGHGVLINMGSVNSRVPMPYYASYVASKHAIVGLGHAIDQELRLNGERDIHVVTIMPWAVDTPWFDHAANYTGRSPRQRLMDGPEVVIDAVVEAAIHPRLDVAPGWKARSALAAHRFLPGLVETVAAGVVQDVQIIDAPAGPPAHSGALHQPMVEGTGVEGGVRDRMRREDEARDQPPGRQGDSHR